MATIPLVTAGCATKALWEEGKFDRYADPAPQPNLSLFHGPDFDRVLVQYDEVREDDETVRRRTYWIRLNEPPADNPFKPSFVSPSRTNGLLLLPLCGTGTNRDSMVVPCADISTNGCEFNLHLPKGEFGPYELPVYVHSYGRIKQVLLTPVTVVADVTVIGGFLFLVAWSEGAFSTVH